MAGGEGLIDGDVFHWDIQEDDGVWGMIGRSLLHSCGRTSAVSPSHMVEDALLAIRTWEAGKAGLLAAYGRYTLQGYESC